MVVIAGQFLAKEQQTTKKVLTIMLSRRHLRVKVMQSLYAYQKSGADTLQIGEKFLNLSLLRIYDLYIHQLALVLEVHAFSKSSAEDRMNRLLPTDGDRDPNLRFVQNEAAVQLSGHKQLQKEINARKISWAENGELIRRIFITIEKDEAYRSYMSSPENDYKADRKILADLYERFLLPNEHIRSILEEKSMMWVSDFDQVGPLVIKTLLAFKQSDPQGGPLRPIYRNEDEDRQFALDLFRKTIAHDGAFQEMIEKKLVNWDLDRVAATDMLLMKMGLCEFMYISSVPTKVTMNEYIEIAKEYSTPKSHVFINGLLDKLLSELKEQDRIKKTGKGLIGG